MTYLRDHFLLDPSVAYLNHGSFGATPEPVFREYQRWQRELESQPTEFLGRRHNGLMQKARTVLGDFIGAASRDVVFTSNVTVALNAVARSLRLGPGDQVLTTDHEYGACDHMWRFLARKRGFEYIRRPVRLPLTTREALVDDFMAGTNEYTRVVFISHITSPTAIVMPVEEICRRARAAGIQTVVDGAHGPGQIPLNMRSLGADFYGGNLHKWLCAPKGAGFLYATPEAQHLLEPLVISWGWESEIPSGSRFIDEHEWCGTRDIAAFLAVPAAIQFQAEHEWAKVRAECHLRLKSALREIATWSGVQSIYADDSWYEQMAAAPLHPASDTARLQKRLYDDYRVEIPVHAWNEWSLMRLSIQAYNSPNDVERLLEGLRQLTRERTSVGTIWDRVGRHPSA